jgi:deazaflavin-dependent oxidoreductase (nitroreductase family)
VVVHRGRKSGKSFRTPVNVFVRGNTYVFALTYGEGSDWVRNVQAAGGCELVTRRATVGLTAPRVEHSDTRTELPRVVRTILRATNVHDYLILDRAA